jgi:hypothetical protein
MAEMIILLGIIPLFIIINTEIFLNYNSDIKITLTNFFHLYFYSINYINIHSSILSQENVK